jgi:hypothetical protein
MPASQFGISSSVSTRLLIAFVLGVVASTVVGALLWRYVDIPPDRLHAQLLAQPEFLADHPELIGGAQAVLQAAHWRLSAQRVALMRRVYSWCTLPSHRPWVSRCASDARGITDYLRALPPRRPLYESWWTPTATFASQFC